MTLQDQSNSDQAPAVNPSFGEDAIVCYCFRQTTRMLKQAYKECGSLRGVEEKTCAGSACAGCKVILQSLFGETARDQNNLDKEPTFGTSCVKPGSKVMKGFVIANGDLESAIYSSNGVAPQLGSCDATTEVEYSLVDHRGQVILQRSQKVKTNETFIFDTTKENLQRPFIGMFMMSLNRSNFGAARFNVYWKNKRGCSSTHELTTTGRPRMFLPIAVDQRFIQGPNRIFLACTNTNQRSVAFDITVFDPDSKKELSWRTDLAPYNSTWIDANQFLFKPALEKGGLRRGVIKIESVPINCGISPVVYFFLHNANTDLWTVNHL